jgi:hypothetical protein
MMKPTKSHAIVAAVALAGVVLAMVFKRQKGAESEQTTSEDLENEGGYCIKLLDAAPVTGQEKYLGGVLGSDGKVYGIPGNAKRVLRIDPDTSVVTFIGPSFGGKYKWLRGVLAKDG